jgi:hypothetical protein
MRGLATALLVLAPFAAAAQERPTLTPSRDVDVVYMMVQADAPGGPRVVEERMRWAAAAGKLRIDPPIPGLWMVMDTRTRRLATVRDADRSVLEIESAQSLPGPAPAAGTPFQRRGADTVAGQPCTEWQTADVTGAPTLACITDDGVLLRASAAGRVLVEALHLSYAAPDPSVFRIPEDYRKITPPPVQRPPP